jgi:DNA-directed RNA polymerase subunit RPC12/RpoP
LREGVKMMSGKLDILILFALIILIFFSIALFRAIKSVHKLKEDHRREKRLEEFKCPRCGYAQHRFPTVSVCINCGSDIKEIPLGPDEKT